jgi:molybdate transport system regulatory protein
MATEIFLRVDFDDYSAIGPYRAALLEAIDDLSSISAAARARRVTYRQAWLTVRTINGMFREPLVLTKPGRKGGAFLTPMGKEVLSLYRAAQRDADEATRKHTAALSRLHIR